MVSIVNGGGALGLNNQPSAASVAGQWTYSPYGEVLTYDALAAGGVHPAVVFGHKTLAVDRLDAPTLTWENESEPGAGDGSLFETQRLVPDGRLIAYARNRTLDIKRGRPLQNDPNAAGSPLSSGGFQGSSVSTQVPVVSLTQRTMDGTNLYSYLLSSPAIGRDPMGTYFLPDTLISATVALGERGKDLAKMGGLNYVRAQLAQNMATLYGGNMIMIDSILTEVSGVGLGAAGGGVGLYQAVERLGGQNSAELFELAGRNFRPNLQALTQFSGRFRDVLFHAHHLIPQGGGLRERFMRIGVNVDNPIFGQWVQDVKHIALHQDGAYVDMFRVFISRLENSGKTGAEAVQETMNFITQQVMPKYRKYGLETPF